MSASPGPTRVEVADLMVVALARSIRPGDVVAVGIGTPLALAAALLARALDPTVHVIVNGAVDPDADLEVCAGGVDAFISRTTGYVPMLDVLDMVERQRATLEFLRPAQVDGSARLNTSAIGTGPRPRVRFPGGLGTADTPVLLPRTIAYLPDHRHRSLPDRVDRITGSGAPWAQGRRTGSGCPLLVTDLAVIGFGPEGAVLRQHRADVTPQGVRARTAFPLHTSADVAVMAPPDAVERAALAHLDPRGRRVTEIREPAAHG